MAKNRECICKECDKEYIYCRTKGHTLARCNSCITNARKRQRKIDAVEYKGGACGTCGYNKSIRALGFHHIDPAQKDFTISGNHCRSWESLKKELDKCILLCANCHMELHDELEGQ